MSKFRVLIISFFLLPFTTTFVHAQDPEVVTDVNGNELRSTTTFVHAQDPEVVTDVNGNELRSGARYYMEVPTPGLMPSAVSDISNGFCPSLVILSGFSNRLPISITPAKYNSTVILEDTYVTVRFNFGYMCRMLISLVWRLDGTDDNRVTTGGKERVNRFKLTKYEGEGGSNKYQLAACPVSECLHDCKCEPVGYAEEANSYAEEPNRDLVAGGRPFPIVFVPVEEPRIAYKLPSM